MHQKSIGNYIVDFYWSKLKLVIELAGDNHRYKLAEDAERQEWVQQFGITGLGFDDLEGGFAKLGCHPERS